MVISEKKLEKLEHSKVRMTATVPMADVKSVYDEMMADYVKSVRIDGFRKGHVPPSVLERKFGDSLRLEAMSRVLEKAVDAALADAEEKPLAYEAPALEGEPEFALDKDFSFSVTYDVFPHFELPSTEGIELEVPGVEVSEEDLAQELERIRERNAIVVEKTGEAALGDIVTVAYSELTEDGREVAGSKREDFTFELGKGLNLYKFDEEVVGMKAGDSKIFPKTYPGDFEYKDLAGKTVMLSVAVSKVKQKDVPALDDELAQDVSEKYKTLEDLKKAVREQLQSALDNRLRELKEKKLVDILLERTSIDVPESMVSAELSMRWESLKRDMGIDSDEKMESIAQYSGKSRQQLYEDWKPAVGKAIAGRLLLDKLVEKSGLEITEEDLSAEYARQAEGSAMSVEEVKAEYEKRQSVEYLKERMKETRFFDSLLATAKLGQGEKKSFVDFMSAAE
ncbi:MAG: trigger factor [Spirochaetia bacterium]|jgi:trigger factor|uniref:peptidylprolyl isomerase n=1 Tax=bioreactor metagenome TaxID=1076179 RepID=A0A644TJC7_9ZZZZ|nr:trigger factor [Spirochaetia bacterium]MCE1209638.1 trigger factor [Spirochaetia bacterium]VBB40785.1 Trigger factor [uncultured Spirochaetota bacterium]HOI21850.1 trigger factor [Spirochaetales bacterium]